MKIKLRERDIQKQIIDWLTFKRIFFYRNNTGAMKKGKDFVRFGVRGAPDIVCIINGHYLGVEVKGEGKCMSDDQLAFAVAVQEAGGLYVCVHSLDELIPPINNLQKWD
jgi:hypothetical protein